MGVWEVKGAVRLGCMIGHNMGGQRWRAVRVDTDVNHEEIDAPDEVPERLVVNDAIRYGLK